MKKTNNKGFSLVELIVVVAIMAVLMVVVAPQMLRYVERTRIQRDNSAIAEIANAAKIAMADETINKSIANGGNEPLAASAGAFTFPAAGETGATALTAELNQIFGDTVTLQGSAYQTTGPVITVAKDSDGMVSVTGTNLLDQDGSGYGADDSGTLVY